MLLNEFIKARARLTRSKSKLNALAAGLQKVAGPSLRHRLTRSPDPTGAPVSRSEAASSKRLVRMVPGSARNWIAVITVQQSNLNNKNPEKKER
jgi:hypothetical protein